MEALSRQRWALLSEDYRTDLAAPLAPRLVNEAADSREVLGVSGLLFCMNESTYIRQCPQHRLELQEIPPYRPSNQAGVTPCELLCPDGHHLVGVAADVDHWLVVHVPSGEVVYEANEDGSRFVSQKVLWVTPSDCEPRPVMVDRIDPRMADPSNWLNKNRKQGGYFPAKAA